MAPLTDEVLDGTGSQNRGPANSTVSVKILERASTLAHALRENSFEETSPARRDDQRQYRTPALGGAGK